MHAGDGTYNMDRAIVDGHRTRIISVGRTMHIGVVDTRTSLEHDWRGSFALDGSTQTPGDGVHPSPLGMRRIAETVWHELEKHEPQSRTTIY